MNMVAKEEILALKTKLLPSGADMIIDFLTGRHEQLDLTHIVLENVPLLIIGRHGMIARIPLHGRMEKVSQPEDILKTLQAFFQKQEQSTLYVFVNLPDLPIPHEITRLLNEIGERARRKEELERKVDEALDARDKYAFDQAVRELLKLRDELYNKGTHYRSI
jgi:hypothetical protein